MTKTPKTKPAAPNFLIDFGPLLVFFALNFIKDIYWATGSLMVTMPLAIGYSYFKRKHVPPMLWISGLLVLVFGSLTLYLQDSEFIKIKATVVFSLFGLILMTGYLFKRPFIRFLFETAFPKMEQRGWMLLTRNWALFFFLEASLNEVIWRNFSTDVWVSFKTFGFLILTFLFMFTQVPVLKKYGNLGKA